MNTQPTACPQLTQRHPVSLILMTIAPITVSLSLATFAHAQESVAQARSKQEVKDVENKEVKDFENKIVEQPVKELSVAPLDVVKYPADRPQWIDSAAEMDGDTHVRVAVSQPSDTKEESFSSLQMMRRITVQLYANTLICGDGLPGPFALREDWIAENVDRFVDREYEGTLHQGDIQLYEHAVELRFPPEAQDEIRRQWKNAEVRGRLGAMGFLVFLGTVLTGCGSAALGVFSRRFERKQSASP